MDFIWLFLAFLAVPIIVHLFNFRRTKKFYFSNIKFINRISTETKSQTRLKHYLLLCSRIFLFISLLYFVFTLQQLKYQSNDKGYFFYLDNSISNSIERNGMSGLAVNKLLVNELLSADQESILLSNEFTTLSLNVKGGEELLNELNSVDFSFSQQPFPVVTNRLNQFNIKQAIFLSDMQGVAIEDMIGIRSDSLHDYSLIVSSLSNLKNAFIDSIFVEYNSLDFNSVKLNLIIGSSDQFIEGNVVVKLLSDGKQLSSVVKKIEEIVTIQFDVPRLGEIKYEIQLSGDDVEYDNTFFLNIGNADKPIVTLITNGVNTYLSQVFRNNDFFDFIEMDINSIDFPVLESSDLIIINNLKTVPNGIFNQLDESTFIVFPSDTSNYLLNNVAKGIEVLKNDDYNLYRTVLDTENSLFFGIFNSVKTKSVMPLGSSIYSFKGLYESVIKLSNGKTFLAKTPDRNVYMLACPLEEKYTNLQVHGIFLPMMYQLAMQSAQQGDFKISYYPNQLVVVENSLSENPVKIVGQNFEIIPEFHRSKRDITLRIPNNIPPGFYSLVQGNDTISSIAVNLMKSESIMDGLDVDELRSFFENSKHVSVYELDDNISAQSMIGEDSSSLWKYALILVLFFVLTETMLHKYLK